MPQSAPIRNFSARYSIKKIHDQPFAEGLQPKIEAFLKLLGADKWIYQLENSRESINPEHNLHYQMFFHVPEKVRVSALAKVAKDSEFRGIHFSAASSCGVQSLKEYCMKTETRVAGPWADKETYLGADLINLEQFTPPQKKLWMYLNLCDPVKHSKRTIIWVVDKQGGSGKSAFKKYCTFHKKWPGFSYASSKDILFIVSQFPGKRVYFFNLSKTRTADVSENELYCALEAIKDGDFTSTKFKPKNVLMNPCHVVVFANHFPRGELLTRERLKVIEWLPLPTNLIRDNFEFDWECEGSKVY